MNEQPNVCLIAVLKLQGITQGKLVRGADLSSETRLSRIINGFAEPTKEEIQKISNYLKTDPQVIFPGIYENEP